MRGPGLSLGCEVTVSQVSRSPLPTNIFRNRRYVPEQVGSQTRGPRAQSAPRAVGPGAAITCGAGGAAEAQGLPPVRAPGPTSGGRGTSDPGRPPGGPMGKSPQVWRARRRCLGVTAQLCGAQRLSIVCKELCPGSWLMAGGCLF